MPPKGRKGFVKSAMRKAGPAADDEASGSDSEPQPSKQAPASPPKKAAGAAPAAAPPPPPPPLNRAGGSDDDDGEHGGPETRGHMVQRHKRELVALKKRAKGGKAEAAKALADLEARHAKELAELDKAAAAAAGGAGAGGGAGAAAGTAAAASGATAADRASKYLASASLADDGEGDGKGQHNHKPSKAQKRREKLAQREHERDARIAAELAALGPTERAQEAAALARLLAPLGLAVKSIRADGHCLYHSVADQLAQHPSAAGGEGEGEGEGAAPLPDYLALRRLAARHMRARRADFEPFVLAERGGKAVPRGADGRKGGQEDDDDDEEEEDGDPFEAYVSAVESTAAWGGHVELTALAGALGRRIRVVAAGMPEVEAGGEHAREGEEPLTVCYVRHEFGLGEHYNSVRPRSAEDEDDEADEGGGGGQEAAGGGSDDDDDE